MNNHWLSESCAEGAKSAILLGPLEPDILKNEIEKNPVGVLWIASKFDDNLNLDQKITFFDKSLPLELFRKTLEDFIILNYDAPPNVKVSSLIANNSIKSYNEFLDLIIAEIDSTMRARRTRSETGFLRQKQIFSNLAGYLNNRLPQEWNDLGKGKLAVVVGAGPSLDVTLPFLNDKIPRPIIIATDSSLSALHKLNIDPDFVVSIDPEKSFSSCCLSEYFPGTVILSSQSHSSWSENWKENICFLSGRVITEDWFGEKGISKTNISAINNAGLTALSVANFLDPAAILMIGMDLASAGHGQQRYAEVTGRDHIIINAAHYHEIPGNFSESVPTPFLSDWQETSEFCKKISKSKLLINLNDRGGKLDGTTLIHPNETEELKEALNQNISPFTTHQTSKLPPKKCLKEMGLNQLLTILTELCDQCWSKLQIVDLEDKTSIHNFLIDTFSNKDFASLFGDFAFSILPKISQGKKPSLEDLQIAFEQLRNLLWILEDAILESKPSKEFIQRFLTERFD